MTSLGHSKPRGHLGKSIRWESYGDDVERDSEKEKSNCEVEEIFPPGEPVGSIAVQGHDKR